MALRDGRVDEAGAMLSAESLRDFLPAKQLAKDVAGKILERARDRFARGDSSAGWHDLASADRLGGQADTSDWLRHQYVQENLVEVRRYLAAGQPTPALVRLEKLQRRALLDETSRLCRQIATLMRQADGAAARGHFAEASVSIAQAKGLAHQDIASSGTMELVKHLDERHGQLVAQNAECGRLATEMHAALASENWSLVLTAADALLAIAPQHAAAGQARRRAWKEVGMDVTQPYRDRRAAGVVSLALGRHHLRGGKASTRPGSRSSEGDTVTGNSQPQRALLWVDAVGGFLACLDDNVILGQPSGGDAIAIPILADLSRRHAAIRRDSGAYVLEPLQRTLLDGREITGPTVLVDNQLIQLGENVRIRFTKPHALSATARLVIESHHKTQPSADAILLMADSCVLGPSKHCHVRCRDWQHDVVVYRQDDQVLCRANESLEVNGVLAQGATEIKSGARIEGQEFAFTWETIT